MARKYRKKGTAFISSAMKRILNDKDVNRAVANFIAERAKTATNPSSHWQDDYDKFAPTRMKGKMGGEQITYAPLPSDLGTMTREVAPVVERNTEVIRAGSNASNLGNIYRVKVETGVPTSRSIIRSGKQNGTRTMCFNDTRLQPDVILGTGAEYDRLDLTVKYGFNEKTTWCPGRFAHISLNDLQNLFEISTLSTFSDADDERSVQRIYADVHHWIQTMKIMNVNRYIDSKVKVYLVKQNNQKVLPVDTVTQAFNGSKNVQDRGTIPVRWQTADVTQSNTAAFAKSIANVGVSWRDSSEAQTHFEVIKTFSKKLKPGEAFEVKHIHHMGPGLRIDQVTQQLRDSNQYDAKYAPFYFMLFEVEGVNCEAIKADTRTYRRMGTAPGLVLAETKTEGKFSMANVQTQINSDNDGTDQSGYSKYNINYRVFTDREQARFNDLGAPFHVPFDKIVSQSKPNPAVDEYVVPVIVDTDEKSVVATS